MSIFKVLSSHSKEKVLLVSSSVLATKADAETRRLFKTVELMYFSVCVCRLPASIFCVRCCAQNTDENLHLRKFFSTTRKND